jgi:hypothetical protein
LKRMPDLMSAFDPKADIPQRPTQRGMSVDVGPRENQKHKYCHAKEHQLTRSIVRMVVIACCHGRSPPEGRNICIIVPWSGSDTVLRVAILHLGIGRPLAALPDPLEAAAVTAKENMSWAGPHPWGVVGPIGLLRHRRITFFATLSGTLCREADISCPKVQLSHNRLA